MAADAALVGSGQSTSNTFTTAAGSVTSGNTLVFAFAYDPGVSISSVSCSTGETLTQIANRTNGTGRLAVYIKENSSGGASVTATANFSGSAAASGSLIKCTGVNAAGYDSASLASGTDSASPYTVTSNAFANAGNVVIGVIEQNSGSSGAYASSNFTMLGSQSDVATYWTHGIAKLVVSSTSAVTPSFTRSGSSSGTSALVVFGISDSAIGGGAPTLSAATPSGTLASTTSATLGATTDSTSGTFYGVVDVAANITGITATQVKAAQNNAGGAPVASGNSTVSTTSPSVGVTGLTANTLYSYAVVQNNGSDSNVLTGTFTTAAAINADVRKFGPKGALTTLLTM